MIRRIPPFVLRSVQVVLSAALLALLWRVADGAKALGLLTDLHPGWLAAAILALTLQTLLSALRWRLTAGQMGIGLDRVTALREYYLAQIINQALPGGVLGDAGRAVRARVEAGLLLSVQAVLFERLAGQIALFAVFAVAVIPTMLISGGLDLPAWLRTPVVLLILLGCTALVILWRVELWPNAAARRFRSALIYALAAPDVRARQVSMSLGTALCNIVAFAFCAQAVGEGLTPLAALVLVPLILLSMLIPLTFGGWGLREGAAIVILPLAGATEPEALAASIAFGSAILIATAPGLFALRKSFVTDPTRI
jgi:glycosyltransferase 2 family protein